MKCDWNMFFHEFHPYSHVLSMSYRQIIFATNTQNDYERRRLCVCVCVCVRACVIYKQPHVWDWKSLLQKPKTRWSCWIPCHRLLFNKINFITTVPRAMVLSERCNHFYSGIKAEIEGIMLSYQHDLTFESIWTSVHGHINSASV